MKNPNIQNESFDTSFERRKQREEADKTEKETIVALFTDAIANPEEYTPVDWGYWELELEPGSSLNQLHAPGSDMLNKLLASGYLPSYVWSRLGKAMDGAYVSGEGSIFIHGDTWKSITDYINNSEYQPQLRCLAEMAKQTGGYIRDNNKAEVTQWLAFHDLTVPETMAQTENLLKYLTFDIPTADHLGNYWAQLSVTTEGQIELRAEQQAAIRKLTTQFLPPQKQLLDKLYEDALNSPQVNADQAGDLIKSMLSHASSRALAKKYLDALGWYGSQPGETVDGEDLDQLLTTAILLELNPFIDSQSPRSPFGSFDLYAPAHVDLPPFLIRQQFETYLVNNQRVSHGAAPLAAHLLLANVAPELLVKELPSGPAPGSIAWVTFCRTVALIESLVPGASRQMTHSQVEEYASIEPVSPEHEQLCALASLDPIIDWALLNSVITAQEWQQSQADALNKATAAYQVFLDQLNQAASAFNTPLPTREAFARGQLKSILPDCTYLEKDFLKSVNPSWQYQAAVSFTPGEPFENLRMSMVDLHMSGDLVSQKWNGADLDIFNDNPTLIAELKKTSGSYETPLLNFKQELDKALVTNLKLAMAQLDELDQKVLQRSDLTVYTVRPSATFETKAPVAVNGRIGFDVLMTVETQEVIDAATGHYGVLICASYRGQHTWYELFSIHGKCLKNTRMAAAVDIAGLQNLPSRMDFNGDLKQYRDPAPLRVLPLDITNYTHGSEPSHQTASHVVLDKLGVLTAPTSTPLRKKGVYQSFQYPQFERIAQFVARHRPLATYEELKEVAKGQTRLEKLISTQDERMEFVLNLIVPFRQCIQDLSSGERSRVAVGVFGCIMDAVAVVGGVVGAAAKIAGIMARTVSACSKIASVAKQLVFLTVATFNPLDGLRPYAALGARTLLKGGLRLNSAGILTVAKARTQLHRLTHVADSYDLIKASRQSDIAQGTWLPKERAEKVAVWASRSGSGQWHAVNRLGRPWGEVLQNFTRLGDIQLPRFGKQWPSLYSNRIIDNALSVANRKLEAAIRMLFHANKKTDTGELAKLLLGDSGLEATNNILMAQKSYGSALSIGNFLLRSTDGEQDVFAFNPDNFQRWKNAGALKAEQPFIDVLDTDLHDRFRDSRLNLGVVADDLTRAMLHAEANVVDLSFALDLAPDHRNYQKLDVAPLLNLASGHLPVADEGFPTRYHNKSDAQKNPDTWAVFISLLSQLETDPSMFARNLLAMTTAIDIHRNGRITPTVAIYLNPL